MCRHYTPLDVSRSDVSISESVLEEPEDADETDDAEELDAEPVLGDD